MAKQIGSQYDFQKIPIIGLVAEQKTTAPSAPVNGQLWFDSTLNVLKVWEVNQWLLVANTAGGSTPAGPAGGDLTGSSYPNPTIANGAVTLAKMASDSVDSSKIVNNSITTSDLLARTLVEGNMSLAIIDPIAANAGLRTLGTGATQAAAGNDARLSDTRTPTDGSVTLAKMAANSVDTSKIVDGSLVSNDFAAAYKDGAAATPMLRSLGDATGQAADGTWTLADIGGLNPNAGPVPMSSQRITGLADGTGANDAVNRGQLDSVAAGLDPKSSVYLATTANIALTGALSIDGVVAGNNRILVKNQTLPAENGIYNANNAGAWTRATDMDAWAEVPGAFTFVEQGSTQADTGWVCTADVAGGTLGTTAITWTQFSGPGSVTAGAGMTQTGNVLNVIAADTSLTVNADNVAVNTGVIATVASLAGYTPTGRTLTTTSPLTIGGGASADLSANRTLAVNAYSGGANTGVVPTGGSATTYLRGDGTWVTPPAGTTVKFAGLVGALVAGVETLVTHSLGTQDVIAAFRDASTNKAVDFDWRAASTTQIGITADIAYSANAIRAVVIG